MHTIRLIALLAAGATSGGCATSEADRSAEHADEMRKLTHKDSSGYDGDNPFED